MLPPKNGKPITFKPTQQLREQTEAIADSLGESLSDYVRKAVEQRNAQHKKPRETMEYKGKTFELFEPPDSTHKNTEHPNPQRIGSREYIDTANGTHKNNTVSKPIDNKQNYTDSCKAKDEYKKEMQQFRSFPKGGDKK
jgi:hypothetical protein